MKRKELKRIKNRSEVHTAGEPLLYFYHSDHLGSASWITSTYGQAIQHLLYLPFGETMVDQRTTTWNSRYSFSAKEKDEESGYSYFGARYYDSDISIWLSVDPMASKYPSLTPYNYCADNPVKLVDPNGEKITNPKKMVLSNRTLMNKLKAFDRAVSRISGLNTKDYTFKITGGDRYKKNGKTYSATNNTVIDGAKASTHLREEGAKGVDLSLSDKISYDVLKQAAYEVGMRLDPDGKYNDGHFHLDMKNYQGDMEYEDNNYVPTDADFDITQDIFDYASNVSKNNSEKNEKRQRRKEEWQAIKKSVGELKQTIQEMKAQRKNKEN